MTKETITKETDNEIISRWQGRQRAHAEGGSARHRARPGHYRPWASQPRRLETKGKVERHFHYVEKSLLNGRTFRSLEHLNEVTRWWLTRTLSNDQTLRLQILQHLETLKIPLTNEQIDEILSAGAKSKLTQLQCKVRQYRRFDLLIIDELGFDKLERREYPESSSLLYKVIDSRGRRGSTALVTNIDFKDWSDYLGDPPLAIALLDRVVDGAIIHKFEGKSYRAHRAEQRAKENAHKRKPSESNGKSRGISSTAFAVSVQAISSICGPPPPASPSMPRRSISAVASTPHPPNSRIRNHETPPNRPHIPKTRPPPNRQTGTRQNRERQTCGGFGSQAVLRGVCRDFRRGVMEF